MATPQKNARRFLAEIRWIGNSRIALFKLPRAQVAELDRAALAVVLDAEPAFERLLMLDLGNEFVDARVARGKGRPL